ncbi:MAG TPA: hypothetical protein VII23_18830 [Terriglobales bacterium]
MAVTIGVLCWTIMSADGFASTPIKSAEVDDSGVVHITANGRQYEVPKEQGQTGVAQLRISQDGRIAGWLVQYQSPAPNRELEKIAGLLILWRDGKVACRIGTQQAVLEDWNLAKGSEKVVTLAGPMHGAGLHFELHRTSDCRLVAEFDELYEDVSKEPSWVRSLEH